MPEPTLPAGRYMPGLDGLRAIAVLSVIAFHLGFGWAPGGLLGVGVFFTLSGYLITDLLLGALAEHRLSLRDFWMRRARRLLPALYVMLAVVAVWVAIASHHRIGDIRGQTISAVLYVNNWWQITQKLSYFARFGPPSPLNHLWSLAVEEQFYLLWPWLLLLGTRVIVERRRPVPARPRLAAAALVLAAISAVEMAILYHPSFDATRIYDATDTRAFGLLIGAALAMVWPSRALTQRVTPGGRRIIDGVGVAGLVTILLLVWRTNEYSPFMYRGGLVLLSVATAAVVAAGAHPASRLGRVLGGTPLRWIGVRSYAIYLWHEPIIVLTTPASSHSVDTLRAAAQVAGAILIAALSWRFVEEPIRRGALGRLWRQARSVDWRPRALPPLTWAVTAGAAALLLSAGLAIAGVRPPSLGGSSHRPPQSAEVGPRSENSPHATSGRRRHRRPGPITTARASRRRPLHSACRSVVHIGDSTSEGLDSSDYLPDPAQRIPAQYHRVGVTDTRMEVTPATSIVESLPGTTNAQTVARGLIQSGYHGCWVLALGTNDTADISVGSSVGAGQRIAKMMKLIGNQPVMWVNVKSLVSGGPYSETDMENWDRALVQACPRYPDMRIYDWAAAVKNRWFIADGIHFYSPGYAARAQLIANALAKGFPAPGATSATGCVVHTGSPTVAVHGVR
ncbi:MAG: acyltransferase [Solirubrobacterales bacterium]|nr:acyltransferase [Solirubrobacterales bacterium]